MKTSLAAAALKTSGWAVLLGLICGTFAGRVSAQPTNYADQTAVANYVRHLLYWPDAGAETNLAAFRYKHLLYTNDGVGVRAQFESIATYYGDTQRTRSQLAEAELRRGLTNTPASAVLGNLLLDIYYDRAVAESIYAQQAYAAAEYIRFSLTSAPPAYVITSEISALTNVLQLNRAALAAYLGLLTNHLGITTDPDAPKGYQIFQALAPGRGLNPAAYLSNGVPVSVITNAGPLFSGHKDLVLLYELLRDYGRTAKELIRLRLCRGNPEDGAEVLSLLSESERYLYLHAELLRGVFPGLSVMPGDASALAEAMAAGTQCLAELGTLRQLINGKQNVLGFQPDFLMLVQKFTGGATYFDSYDALRERLDPANSSGPMAMAKTAWLQARASYAQYRGYQDQLASEFSSQNSSALDRLFEIVGAYPGDPEYATPDENAGSELSQQVDSIEVARLRIQRNQAEINNLNQEVQIELWRAGAVSNTYIRFANERAAIAEKIGHINAVQQAANAAAEAANASTWWGGAAQGVNAAVQAGAEEWKGQLEAEKERQAGMEQAEVEGIESKARVKTLLLGMNTLAVDSQEAAILLKQEVGRLTALLREKEALECSLAENQEDIAHRYFADPSHRLQSQNDMVLANLAFESAQRWMFFMARALEYKWNTPFTNYNYLGRYWSSATVFRLRNAAELEDLWRAMDDYESQIQLTKTDHYDWFSVREDFFGYRGGTNRYIDPSTGESLDATNAFRRRLQSLQDPQGNIRLEFSTVREIPGGSFFRGPRFATNGNVVSAGMFLDKITWMKINLPGSHSLGRSMLNGDLAYGGVSYIRRFDVGEMVPDHPDRIANELTAYSTRFWYFHPTRNQWESQPALTAIVTMVLTNDSRVPPSVPEIEAFKERSVAATGWTLLIPTFDLGEPVLHISELDDVELYFYHYAVSRPLPAPDALLDLAED